MRLLRHVGSELAAHPGRSALSGLSLFIGVVAIVAIFTIGLVTFEVFVAGVEQQSGRRITISTHVDVPSRDPAAAIAAMNQALTPLPTAGGGFAVLTDAHGRFGRPTEFRDGSPLTGPNVAVTLVSGDLGTVRRLPVLAGGWFDESVDYPLQMVVNMPAAQILGGPGSVWLWQPTPNSRPLQIIVCGVIADGSADAHAYVPLLNLARLHPYAVIDAGDGTDSSLGVELLLHHPTATTAALRELAAAAAVAAGAQAPDAVERIDQVDHYRDQLRAQQTAFLIVAVIALTIAALGILNIGLASVSERARELVIRRAMGATRTQIVLQLLVAAAAIGAITAGLAVVVAVVGVQVWAPTLISPQSAATPPSFPWAAAGWGLLASVTTTLLGAAIPAALAARLDIATALRD